jgi:ribokinase
MTPRIVVAGSLNADLTTRVPRFPRAGETLTGDRFETFPGGKGANQAYAAARLGAQVAMVGQVGADGHGAWLKQHLADGGVDVSCVAADPASATGVAVILIDASGQNEIVLAPGANGTFTTDRLRAAEGLIGSAAFVLLQLEIPLETVEKVAEIARRGGALVILDPAPARDIPDELLAAADYVTPNETELAILTGETGPMALRDGAAALRARGARTVIVKAGAQGALLIGEAREYFWPAIAVDAVDTTAAGDAFNAAFAVALTAGQNEDAAGRFATAAAACSVTHAGAQTGMPTRDEVEFLLRKS